MNWNHKDNQWEDEDGKRCPDDQQQRLDEMFPPLSWKGDAFPMLRNVAWVRGCPARRELLDALSDPDRAQVNAFLAREDALLRTTDASGAEVLWCSRPTRPATVSYIRTTHHLTIDDPFIRRGDRVIVCINVEEGESPWQVFREWFADVRQLGVQDDEGNIPATAVPVEIGGAA